MKKTYVTPDVEKVAFQYRDQVVVASGGACTQHYGNDQDLSGANPCTPTHWTANNTHLNG